MRVNPLYLWYKTGKTMQEMSADEKNNIITEIDVLFGEDRPWFGFEKLDPPVTPEQEDLSSVFVTYRRGVKRKSTGRRWDGTDCLPQPFRGHLHFIFQKTVGSRFFKSLTYTIQYLVVFVATRCSIHAPLRITSQILCWDAFST